MLVVRLRAVILRNGNVDVVLGPVVRRPSAPSGVRVAGCGLREVDTETLAGAIRGGVGGAPS